MDRQYNEAISFFNESIRAILASLPIEWQCRVKEIRVTEGVGVRISVSDKRLYISKTGELSGYQTDDFRVAREDISESLLSLCNYSVHSHIKQLAGGYITLKGGHRVGVSGEIVYDESGQIKTVRNISSYIVRIARNFEGVGRDVSALLKDELCGVIIASEPSGGKTTILCDIAKELSEVYDIAVVDERGEMSDRVRGKPMSVLKGVSKAEGIMLAIRSLSPSLIICDEIGGREDLEAVNWSLNCGVPIVTTIHSSNMQELIKRKAGQELLKTEAFKYAAFLKGRNMPGKIKEVVCLDNLKNNGNFADNSGWRNVWDVAGGED